MKEAVEDFLAQKRIAVAGVSRNGSQPANFIYRKLRGAGYQVFAVNPSAKELEGDRCYPDLASIPETVDGIVIATKRNALHALTTRGGRFLSVGISQVAFTILSR